MSVWRPEIVPYNAAVDGAPNTFYLDALTGNAYVWFAGAYLLIGPAVPPAPSSTWQEIAEGYLAVPVNVLDTASLFPPGTVFAIGTGSTYRGFRLQVVAKALIAHTAVPQLFFNDDVTPTNYYADSQGGYSNDGRISGGVLSDTYWKWWLLLGETRPPRGGGTPSDVCSLVQPGGDNPNAAFVASNSFFDRHKWRSSAVAPITRMRIQQEIPGNTFQPGSGMRLYGLRRTVLT
jgi:hypothetical protein